MSEFISGIASKAVSSLGFSFLQQRTQVGEIKLDLLASEQYELPGEVTKYPTEDGSEMSDHIILQSATLTIEGRVSNAVMGVVDLVQNFASFTTKQADIVAQFEALRDKRDTLTVTTGLRQFEDFAIESLSFSRSAGESGWLNASIKLVKIRKVQLRRADVPSEPRTGRTAAAAGRNTPNNAQGAAGAATGAAATPSRPNTAFLNGLRASGLRSATP